MLGRRQRRLIPVQETWSAPPPPESAAATAVQTGQVGRTPTINRIGISGLPYVRPIPRAEPLLVVPVARPGEKVCPCASGCDCGCGG